MNLSFENKVALVTGAASGMGLATAKAFAVAGAAVALADVNEAALRSAADDLVAAGHKAIGIRCDVADEAEVAAMVEQTVSTFGRLDAAFNNAGVQAPPSDMADEAAGEFDRVNAINLRGVWACMKRTPPYARAGERRDRQLLIAGWSRGTASPGGLPRVQARRDRTDQECRA